MQTVNQIADAAFANAQSKGFHDSIATTHPHEFIKGGVCLLHEEVSELFSALRAKTFFDLCDKADTMLALGLPQLTCAEEEYADIVIRVFDQCRRLGIDIQAAIQVKHAYNTTRPHMHGGKAL